MNKNLKFNWNCVLRPTPKEKACPFSLTNTFFWLQGCDKMLGNKKTSKIWKPGSKYIQIFLVLENGANLKANNF